CWLHGVHVTDVPGTAMKDASSPYGYGGPLCSSDDPAFVADACEAYAAWMRAHDVVVEYIRFHPAIGNDRHYRAHIVDSRPVVWVDLRQEHPAAAYSVRLRQAIKKAAAAGLVYREAGLRSVLREFGEFYRAGMREIGADAFYLFSDAYFGQLAAGGLARVGFCCGADGQWLAAALFLDGQAIREYHLAAGSPAGRTLSAASFVLHEAGLAARARGCSMLYLGGGSDPRPDNPLLFFKSGFSPQRLVYRTGWSVFDDNRYDELKQRFPRERAAHPERPIFHRIV
ncbi:MAG TPA: GNAT family N-acetyltransferase, partial [Ramlibacter sp.]|nr:GNAT family N-acetyltransferase [Ramlibacter sp.]